MPEKLDESLRPGRWWSRYSKRFGNRKTLGADLKAGVVLGTESVPDGLAAGLLAGVNPVFGLYAYLAGTLGGALATGSVLMTVQTTGAMGVLISDIPAATDPETSEQTLMTLALLTGLIMLVMGFARLGSLVRFIPTAVLAGFVNAVAINIILGQLGSVTGFHSEVANRIGRAFDTVAHVAEFSLHAVIIAALRVALTLILERTKIGSLAMLVAVGVASAVAVYSPLDVTLLGDSVEIPGSLPTLGLPDSSLVFSLIVPALSLALVGLVQGAGISGSVPNPNGRYADPSSDFRGQGIANLFAGVAQGMPVGGSMSATSLVRDAGARTALANLVAAVVMAVTIVAAHDLIGSTAMPALGALLVIIGVRTLRPKQMLMVCRTGPIQATGFGFTFALTLLIPMQYAVLSGVALAFLLHVVRQSSEALLVQWVFDPGELLPREQTPVAELSPGETVVLVPYGSLFFAAAPRLEQQLPIVPHSAEGTFVVIRIRNSQELGATAIGVLTGYADRLRAAGATLLLVGLNPRVAQQLTATGAMTHLGPENVFQATSRVGDSLHGALSEIEHRRLSP